MVFDMADIPSLRKKPFIKLCVLCVSVANKSLQLLS